MSTPSLPCPNCNHPADSHYVGNKHKGCAVSGCPCILSRSEVERRASTSESTNVPDIGGHLRLPVSVSELTEKIPGVFEECSQQRVSSAAALRAVTKDKELIDHPDHYGGADNPYECIKVIEGWQLDDFCLGNVIKYICRHTRKEIGREAELQDLKKAAWYLNRRIEQLSKPQS